MGTDEMTARKEDTTGDFLIAVWREAAPDEIVRLDPHWTMALVEAVRELGLSVTVTQDHFGFQTEADRETVLALANRRYEEARARFRKLLRLDGYLR